MAKIQHADLPDQYLHEPKGASTAVTGTVYIADGNGSGGFGFIPMSSLNFERPTVTVETYSAIPTPVNVNGTGLLSTANGIMVDVQYVTQVPVATIQEINKNFKELFTVYARDVSIHEAVKEDIEKLESKLNTVITALQSIGVLQDDE